MGLLDSKSMAPRTHIVVIRDDDDSHSLARRALRLTVQGLTSTTAIVVLDLQISYGIEHLIHPFTA